MTSTASPRNAQKIMAFKKVHTDFKEIMKHEKCRTCSCFYGDVLNSIYDRIKRFREIESDHNLAEIENDFERWLRGADPLKAHGWLGCKPCLPVPAFNTFNEVIDSLEGTDDDSIVPFKTELIRPDDFIARTWPPQPGDYRIFNARKSIALALLQSVDLDDPSLAKLFSKIAIAGSITTENLGVEHLVKNVIANPYLRYLVLVGNDIDGHMPGDALLNLSDKGVDRSKRIIGARGARPALKNLTKSEVAHFRKQISVINLIGKAGLSELGSQLELIDNQAAQPYEAGLKVDLVEIKRAEAAKRLKLDPSGYFVIVAMKGKEYPLLVEHYSNDGNLLNIIEGKDAASICATLIDKKLVSQLDHAAYLGREFVKAEMSLLSDLRYIQDQAQGKLQSD